MHGATEVAPKRSTIVENTEKILDAVIDNNESIASLRVIVEGIEKRMSTLESSNTPHVPRSAKVHSPLSTNHAANNNVTGVSTRMQSETTPMRKDSATSLPQSLTPPQRVKRVQKCDYLILSDSILRRIIPHRFSRNQKTVKRFIRGGPKTCSTFIKKFGSDFQPSNVLIHIGTRDLQGSTPDIHENDFTSLFELMSNTWPEAMIYFLPLIRRKDIPFEHINNANLTIKEAAGKTSSKVKIIDRFNPTDEMFYDDVHLNNTKGLPALVKHLKSALNMKMEKRQSPKSRDGYGVPSSVPSRQQISSPPPPWLRPNSVNPNMPPPWMTPPPVQNLPHAFSPWAYMPLPWNNRWSALPPIKPPESLSPHH